MEKEFFQEFFTRVEHLFSKDEIEKIMNAKIFIAGLGGVGSSTAYFLARYGVKNFVLVDPDVVEISNLNRQFFFYPDIGTPKVFAIKKLINLVNPYTNVKAYYCRIEDLGEELEDIIEWSDIVVDGMDNYVSKVRLSRLAKKKKKPLVHASGLGSAAKVTIFTPDGPYYEEVFGLPSKNKPLEELKTEDFKEYMEKAFLTYKEEYLPEDLIRKMISGEIPFQVLLPATILSGLLAATEIIKALIGRPFIKAPQILYIDLWTAKLALTKAEPW